ncbi:flagellar hook-associated protein FlgL [Jatrophihabitans fulvus]
MSATTASIANIQAAAQRLAVVQNQLSSGKRITTASDDPEGTVTAMALRSELSRSGQYTSAGRDALARLSTADSAYSQSVSVLQSARTLVVQALNSGTTDATANSALAQQFDGLRSTLLSLANTTFNGQPVFGGTTDGDVAYDASGAYVGNAGSDQRQVGAHTVVEVGAVGTDVFGSGATDVFQQLSDLAAALRAGTPLSGSDLDTIDTAVKRVSTAQAAAGTVYQQVQTGLSARLSTDAALKTRLTDIVSVDPAEAAIQTAAANLAYNAAIQTTATVNRQSLLDFLR